MIEDQERVYHDVRQTSLLAYQEVTSDGTKGKQSQAVLELLRNNPDGLTREEIRDIISPSVMYSSICARVNSLLKANKVYEHGDKRMNKSGKAAYVVRAYA